MDECETNPGKLSKCGGYRALPELEPAPHLAKCPGGLISNAGPLEAGIAVRELSGLSVVSFEDDELVIIDYEDDDDDLVPDETDCPPPDAVPPSAAYVNWLHATDLGPGCTILRSSTEEESLGSTRTQADSQAVWSSLARSSQACDHITNNLQGVLGQSPSTESLVKSLSEQLPSLGAHAWRKGSDRENTLTIANSRQRLRPVAKDECLGGCPSAQSLSSMASASQMALQLAGDLERRILRDDSDSSLPVGSQPWDVRHWLKAIRLHQTFGHPSAADLHQAMSHSSSVTSLLSVLSEPEAKRMIAPSQSTGRMQSGMLHSASSRSLLSVVSEEAFVRPTSTRPIDCTLATSPGTDSAKELKTSQSQGSEYMPKVTWVVEQVIDFGIPMQVEEKFFDNSFFGLFRLPSLSCLVQQPRPQPLPQMLCYSPGQAEQQQQQARHRREAAGIASSPKPALSHIAGSLEGSERAHSQCSTVTQSPSAGGNTAVEAGNHMVHTQLTRSASPPQAQASTWARQTPPRASSGLPWFREMWNRIAMQ
mmetsp:Transcript_28231/g.65282  ORF Transcript_28231/g.65282 Transcript_28231/m.65282 type:complete len:537 (-) Transcript_28231:144-1754(-)